MSAIPNAYVPQDGKLFSVSMGLRALAQEHWLEIDQQFASEIAQKRQLITTQSNQVFQAIDAGLAGSIETLELIESHLKQFYFENEAVNKNLIELGEGLPRGMSDHPLVLASLMVQEDLCVMTKLDDQWVLTAAAVCFPSRWDLTTKIGTNLHQIHAPVPHYEERIGSATDVMFDKFTADRPVWRINWTILDQPDLFQPATSHQSARPLRNRQETSEDFASNTFLRIERQTLRVLPKSQDVLFTIHTYVDSLDRVAHKYPEFRHRLQSTLAGVSEQTKSYKGWDEMWPQLLDWCTVGE